MNKPLREKPQSRKKKPQNSVAGDSLPDMMKELEDLRQRFFLEQRETFDRFVASGPGACCHDDPCTEVRNRWQNFVRDELLHGFLVTPVGPLRQYHEKFNRLMEAFAEWEAACQVFITLMTHSMTLSLADLQEKIRDRLSAGRPVDDLFPQWVRLFEDRSLALFRSAEFMAAMHKALKTKTALVKAQEELMEDVLKVAHIPTLSEMDDISRDVYLLKKRIETLEKAMKDRHGRTR